MAEDEGRVGGGEGSGVEDEGVQENCVGDTVGSLACEESRRGEDAREDKMPAPPPSPFPQRTRDNSFRNQCPPLRLQSPRQHVHRDRSPPLPSSFNQHRRSRHESCHKRCEPLGSKDLDQRRSDPRARESRGGGWRGEGYKAGDSAEMGEGEAVDGRVGRDEGR